MPNRFEEFFLGPQRGTATEGREMQVPFYERIYGHKSFVFLLEIRNRKIWPIVKESAIRLRIYIDKFCALEP